VIKYENTNRDPSLVQLIHGVPGRDTDGTHEQRGLFFDDHVDECRQLALGVIDLLRSVRRVPHKF
jgi:hypothetical protein